MDVAVVDRPLTQSAMDRAAALIEENKAQRCVLRTLRTSLQSRGALHIGIQLLAGDTTTVYPLQPQDIQPPAVTTAWAFAAHDAITTTVYPMP